MPCAGLGRGSATGSAVEDWARPVGGVGVETEPDRAPVSDTVAFIHGLIGQLVDVFIPGLTHSVHTCCVLSPAGG